MDERQGRSFPPPSACDHRSAIDEIVKEQSLLAQLRSVILPALDTMADGRMELVAEMFGSIEDCSRKVIHELQFNRSEQTVDTAKRLIGNISDYKGSIEKKSRSARGKHTYSASIYVTPVPHHDGHQWRKYGQKNIVNSKHQRSYYRCTYKHEQNCQASKTVQLVDNTSEPMMYKVVYYGRHTCEAIAGLASAPVIETGSPQSAVTSYHIGDHKTIENIRTPQEELCPVNTSGHRITLDYYLQMAQQQLIDVIRCAPLDSDIWEIDAIVRFGASGYYDH